MRWLKRVAEWLADSPGKITTTDVTVYRIRNSYLALGVICTASFVAFGVASVIAAWWNIDGSFRFPKQTAIGFGIGWSGFAAVGGWIILAYYRERLFTSDQGIRQRGCIRDRTMIFDEVASARWRRHPKGGSLVLRDPDHKVVVFFDNFSPTERIELIQYFRAALDETCQANWPDFGLAFLAKRTVIAKRVRTNACVVGLVFLLLAVTFAFSDMLFPGKPRNVPIAVVNVLAGVSVIWKAMRRREDEEPDAAAQPATNGDADVRDITGEREAP